MAQRRKLNLREIHQAKRAAAMPEVKRLVRKFGRRAIAGCLNKIRDTEKVLSKISQLKREARELKNHL